MPVPPRPSVNKGKRKRELAEEQKGKGIAEAEEGKESEWRNGKGRE